MDLGLQGKVGLVTGGSRGIGRATALRLAAEGCAVGICGRTAETLERTVAELRVLRCDRRMAWSPTSPWPGT